MVRSALAYGVFAASVLAFAAPAAAAQEEPGGKTESARVPSPPALQLPETPPGSGTCGVCADPACTTVRLYRLCTMDKAMKTLHHRKANGAAADGATHRSRAVTGADYEPLVLDEVPEPGRATAAPKNHPQGRAGASQPQYPGGIHHLPPGEGKSDSLSGKTQSFRPLDLDEETADDDDASGETEEADR